MTDSAKIMAAGCAAGAAAAVIPTVYGIVKTFSRPFEERDRLTAQGDGFVTAAGKQVFLRGINLADALPELLRDGEVLNAGSSEIFRFSATASAATAQGSSLSATARGLSPTKM